jgi:hypothetical protein
MIKGLEVKPCLECKAPIVGTSPVCIDCMYVGLESKGTEVLYDELNK